MRTAYIGDDNGGDVDDGVCGDDYADDVDDANDVVCGDDYVGDVDDANDGVSACLFLVFMSA